MSQTSFGQTMAGASSAEVALSNVPEDSVSALRFADVAPSNQLLLACTSWNGVVAVWQVDSRNGESVCRVRKPLDSVNSVPIINFGWYKDNTKLFLAMADNSIKCLCLESEKLVDLVRHNAAATSCHYYSNAANNNAELLMSTSLDKTCKFWDLRQPQEAYTLTHQQPLVCSDLCANFAVVCTGGGSTNQDSKFFIYNLRGEPQLVKERKITNMTHFSHVKIMKDDSNQPIGCVVASSLGKVSFEVPDQEKLNITFPCHRIKNPGDIDDIYAVNCLAINPVHKTLATVGSDGIYAYWDLYRRTSLMKSKRQNSIVPITACDINSLGNLFALARGYDWSKGYLGYTDQMRPSISIVTCFNEMKKKN